MNLKKEFEFYNLNKVGELFASEFGHAKSAFDNIYYDKKKPSIKEEQDLIKLKILVKEEGIEHGISSIYIKSFQIYKLISKDSKEFTGTETGHNNIINVAKFQEKYDKLNTFAKEFFSRKD